MSNQNNKPAGREVEGVVPDEETVISMLGEGIHTGLRKGSDTEKSGELWNAIRELDDGCWGDALNYAYWGLRYMGYEIVKVSE